MTRELVTDDGYVLRHEDETDLEAFDRVNGDLSEALGLVSFHRARLDEASLAVVTLLDDRQRLVDVFLAEGKARDGKEAE